MDWSDTIGNIAFAVVVIIAIIFTYKGCVKMSCISNATKGGVHLCME